MRQLVRFKETVFILIGIGILWSGCVKRLTYEDQDICAIMTCEMDSVYVNASNYSSNPFGVPTDMTQVNFNEVILKDFNTIGSNAIPEISLLAEHNCLSGTIMFEFAKIENDIRIKAFAQNISHDTIPGLPTTSNCPPQIVKLSAPMQMPQLPKGKYNLTFKNKIGTDIRTTIEIF